jgi:hypothetical protein
VSGIDRIFVAPRGSSPWSVTRVRSIHETDHWLDVEVGRRTCRLRPGDVLFHWEPRIGSWFHVITRNVRCPFLRVDMDISWPHDLNLTLRRFRHKEADPVPDDEVGRLHRRSNPTADATAPPRLMWP